jgi:hypothetical protein
MRMSENKNKLVSIIFGLHRKDETEYKRKSHSEELH